MEYEERESEFDIEDEDKSEPEQTGNISQLKSLFLYASTVLTVFRETPCGSHQLRASVTLFARVQQLSCLFTVFPGELWMIT